MNEIVSYLSQDYYESPFWGCCSCCCGPKPRKKDSGNTNNQDVCLSGEEKKCDSSCQCGKNVEGTPGEVCYTCYNGNACTQ